MDQAIKLQRHLDKITNKMRVRREFQEMARQVQVSQQTTLIDEIKEGIEETNETM